MQNWYMGIIRRKGKVAWNVKRSKRKVGGALEITCRFLIIRTRVQGINRSLQRKKRGIQKQIGHH